MDLHFIARKPIFPRMMLPMLTLHMAMEVWRARCTKAAGSET
jgi:hypothetical protein